MLIKTNAKHLIPFLVEFNFAPTSVVNISYVKENTTIPEK